MGVGCMNYAMQLCKEPGVEMRGVSTTDKKTRMSANIR